jgi:hypothetical protein
MVSITISTARTTGLYVVRLRPLPLLPKDRESYFWKTCLPVKRAHGSSFWHRQLRLPRFEVKDSCGCNRYFSVDICPYALVSISSTDCSGTVDRECI